MRQFHLSNLPDLKIELDGNAMAVVGNGKPKGFWYDVNLDWIRWLEGEDYLENPRWMRPYLYEVEINKSEIIVIRNEYQFDEFNRRFHVPIFDGAHMNGIDWAEVAKHYGGVEIAPYLHSRRLSFSGDHLDAFWYYGWDCASGVIWRSTALKSVRLVRSGEKKIVEFYRRQKATEDD